MFAAGRYRKCLRSDCEQRALSDSRLCSQHDPRLDRVLCTLCQRRPAAGHGRWCEQCEEQIGSEQRYLETGL